MKKAKYIIILLVLFSFITFQNTSAALTKEEIIENLKSQIAIILQQIQILQQQLIELTGGQVSGGINLSAIPQNYTFSDTLRLGFSSNDVKYLQILLNQDSATQVSSSGWGSPGQESMYFGSKTQEAVKKFQQKHKQDISSYAGYAIAGTGYAVMRDPPPLRS